ncbi:glycoside hydrolase/deacetylase [Lichtheimia hyalospora FSU 10163]|nr:glycoside hydrolase/deacetylase [Lichtheimia hyalospora FSU 10163]
MMKLTSCGTAAALLMMAAAQQAQAQSPTSSGILSVPSPTWLPDFPKPSGVVTSYPTGPADTGATLDKTPLNLTAYPEPWGKPTTDHPEIKAVMDAIDWDHVPNATIHKAKSNGDLDMDGYDDSTDPFCWWSDTNCVKPKVDYLPEDIYYCPNVGDWGLNFDDGPYNPSDDDEILNKYSEPELYNFLAEHNQTATLFYIGSNVATYPAAARRALNNGHVLCIHTWSHPQMTAQTNEQVVAEFYWSLRAVKEATGVTSRCWRPPYGDVDDRVRAIAWQMGMRTIVWDQDTNDWDMPGDGGGNLSPDTVNGFFEDWINSRKNGTDNEHGHITLEHELNNATVTMAEKWLPELQKNFNVVNIQQCMNISQPYWETDFVYPTEKDPKPAQNSTASSSAASSGASASSTSAASGSSSDDGDSQNQQDGQDTSMATTSFTATSAWAISLLSAGAFYLVQ